MKEGTLDAPPVISVILIVIGLLSLSFIAWTSLYFIILFIGAGEISDKFRWKIGGVFIIVTTNVLDVLEVRIIVSQRNISNLEIPTSSKFD